MSKTIHFVIFFVVSGCCCTVLAQAKQDKNMYEEFEGGFVNPTIPNIPVPKPPPLKILKYENKGLLTGNACAYEETRNFGFEYIVVCQKDSPQYNRVWVFFYNMGTNLQLTFINGPGWKSRLKKKIIECKRNSADIVW